VLESSYVLSCTHLFHKISFLNVLCFSSDDIPLYYPVRPVLKKLEPFDVFFRIMDIERLLSLLKSTNRGYH
jgi:hypothetical protein